MLLFLYGVLFATIITPVIHKIAELLCVLFDVAMEKIVGEQKDTEKRIIGFVASSDEEPEEEDEEE